MPNIDGQRLLAEIESNLRLFCYMPEHAYPVMATWIAQSHLRDVDGYFMPFYSGRMYVGSVLPGCGKSTIAKVAVNMCYGGKTVLNPTPPAMVAYYNEQRRTIAFDEFDQYMGRGGKATIKTIINGGWQRGETVANVRRDQIVEYDISGPMLLIGKNLQPFMTAENFDTIRTRSFVIAVDRKPKDAEVDKYSPERHDARLFNLRDNLTRWGMIHAPFIVNRDIVLPDGIINRDEDIWTPLFRIADYVGGEWPSRIARAAKAMVLNQHDDDSMPIVTPYDELLAAVRAIFDSTNDVDYISTSDIVNYLMAMPESWWHYEWKGSRRSAEMGLAAALRTHGITSVDKRQGESVLKCYSRIDITGNNDSANDDSTIPTQGWT